MDQLFYGEGMTIKGLGMSSAFVNGFPESRDPSVGQSIYNFTNPRRKKRKLLSARHQDGSLVVQPYILSNH